MPEPLKNVYNTRFLRELASRIQVHKQDLDEQKFKSQITAKGWKTLELKDRMSRIAQILHASIGEDYKAGCDIVAKLAKDYRTSGKTGFEYMFLPDYVEQFAQHDFSLSMRTFASITETGSAEFAIRPLIKLHPERAIKQLNKWATHNNEHLRRLASEGCRPRLPWAMALPDFKQDPRPILGILEQLKGDPSLYVRRSVANNLNDISKDQPDLALSLASRWIGDTQETDWLVKHACRGLLKQGHPEALALFGYQTPTHIRLTNLRLPKVVQFGSSLDFSFELRGKQPLGLIRLEYAIDLRKANGSYSNKVFKISESTLQEQHKRVLKSHKFVPISTRKYYAGKHRLSIIVNGATLVTRAFDLQISD